MLIEAVDYDVPSWCYYSACELLGVGCGDDLIAAVTGQTIAGFQHLTGKNIFAVCRSDVRLSHCLNTISKEDIFSKEDILNGAYPI